MINIIGNRIGAKKSGGAANQAFEFTVDTTQTGTSAADQFTIPTTGTGYNYDISTSDGQIISGATGNTTITFPSAGSYTIKITGDFPRIYFNGTGDRLKITNISNWGVGVWDSFDRALYNCNNMTITATDVPNVSAVTSFYFGFRGTAISGAIDLSSWDLSSVSQISYMFANCTGITSVNLSSLGTNAIASDGAFLGANSTTTVTLPVGFRPTVFRNMFSNANSLTDIVNVETWNLSSAVRGDYWLQNTTVQPNISGWTIPPTFTILKGIFAYCQFNVDVSGWDVSNVQDFSELCAGNSAFNQDISGWNMASATNLDAAFASATSFNQPIGSWNVSNVTSMKQVFQNATSFNQDISSWNVSNVGRADRMFSGATSFNQNLPNWTWTNLQFQGLDYMFERAYAFNGDLSNWTFPNVTRLVSVFDGVGGNMAFNNSSIANWDVSNITSLANTFRKCESFNVDLSSWNTASLTNMTNTFFNCGSFNQPLNSWNVSNVTTFSYCFYFATSFNQPLNNWNVSSCTRFNQMFFQATSFNQNIGNWNMSSAVSGDTFKEMFRNATAYDNGGQPINWITVAGPTDISQWFYNTPAFTQSLQSINITTAVNNLNFTFNSNITTSNYDATLVAWESQLQAAYPGGVGYTPPLYTWQFSGATYTLGSAAETARTSLVNTFGWTITDGGGVLTNESYLVASYNFDSNFTDYTGNNNLTAFGNATAGVTGGKVSNCLEVDGVDDYGLAVDSDDFSFTNGSNDLPFSISLWANADTLGTGNLVQKRGVTSLLEYQVFILSSQIVVNLFSGGNTTNQLRTRVFDTYSTGVWYHITVTYDGSGNNSGLKVYVNGSLPTQTLDPLNSYVGMSNTTSAFTIGTYGSGVDDFDGKIDEVHVWKNRELTAAEVTDIYNTENAGNSILP